MGSDILKKIKQLLSIAVMVSLGVSFVGCSRTMDGVAVDEQEFIKVFEETINRSFERQTNLWDDFEKYSSYTKENYKNEMKKVLQNEIDTIDDNKEAIINDKLKRAVEVYVEGVNKQIESINATEEETAYKYEEEANELRKESLLLMVENYGVNISEKNKQIYNEILENVIRVEKENKPQSFVEKLANDVKLKMAEDNFGDVNFLALFENTSNLYFKNLSYKVEYKNERGEIVSHEYISIKDFTPGDTKKIKLTPYQNEVVSADLFIDWYETK